MHYPRTSDCNVKNGGHIAAIPLRCSADFSARAIATCASPVSPFNAAFRCSADFSARAIATFGQRQKQFSHSLGVRPISAHERLQLLMSAIMIFRVGGVRPISAHERLQRRRTQHGPRFLRARCSADFSARAIATLPSSNNGSVE